MSNLPEPNQTRIESYLGELADQEGAEMPAEPQSRVEQYLEWLCENGGGGSGQGILVGNVKAGDSFPTQRPDGTPLKMEDYVRPASNATFPFTIGDVTFTGKRDKAFYNGSGWMIDPGVLQDTSETPVKDKTTESISGTKTIQSEINKEVKNAIAERKAKDVQVADVSVVDENGIAKVPIANSSKPGVVKAETAMGIGIYTDDTHKGKMYIVKAADEDIVAKTNDKKPIVPANLDKAVMEGLGNSATVWDATHQARAKEVLGIVEGGNSLAQYTTMPTASADNVGKIVQYIGATDTEYTNGFIYVCISQAGTPVTYSWVRKTVQNDAVDNETIGLNSSDEKYVKDNSITLAKLKTQATTDVGKVPKVKADGTWELGTAGGGTDTNAVHYTAETKTEAEKTQARTNIGASKVAVSTTGTATTEAKYITIDDTEYKLAGGGGSVDIDGKVIIKDADDKLTTAVGGYDTRQTFSGDIVKNATATETSAKIFEFNINEATKTALATTFKSAPTMSVNMYNKVTIAGTDFEHRMNVTVTKSTDGVWTVTLYLEVSGANIPVPIEINANTGKMVCNFTAVPDAYPIDSVFATATATVNIGELSYIDTAFINHDEMTIIADDEGMLKSIYGGGRVTTGTETITSLTNSTATYVQDIETFKMFAFSSFAGADYFKVGNIVSISFNYNGTIVGLNNVKIKKCYEEVCGEFDGIVLDSILGEKTYFTVIDNAGVIISESISEDDALICKSCVLEYKTYWYSPVQSRYIPYSDRFFYADSATDEIMPKVQFGTWEEAREVINHIGSTEFTTTSNFIVFEANRENTVKTGNYVEIGYSVNHPSRGRIRAEANGSFVQHSAYCWYASLEDMEMGDENIFQNIRIFTNTTPATIQLQLVNEIAIEDILSIDEMTVRQNQYDEVDHPIASKYLKLDTDMLAVNSDGKVFVKVSSEAGNKLEVKSDGLYVGE